jgi:cytochrome c
MKKRLLLTLAVAALHAQVALAGPQELAVKHNCMGCHTVDKKLVGPAFKDIAAKYKGKDVAADLTKKVKAGGTGVWGTVPMPPNPAPEGEVRQVVDWILTH